MRLVAVRSEPAFGSEVGQSGSPCISGVIPQMEPEGVMIRFRIHAHAMSMLAHTDDYTELFPAFTIMQFPL